MADTNNSKSSYTVFTGANLLQEKPASDPYAGWTPVQLVNDAVVPPTVGNRFFVKKNDQPDFGDGQVGARKLRIVIGGAQKDDTKDTVLVQAKAPDYDPDNKNGTLPVVSVQIGAEMTGEGTDEDNDVLDASLGMAPFAAMISELDDEGNMTIAVRIKTERTAHGLITLVLDFGYSASN